MTTVSPEVIEKWERDFEDHMLNQEGIDPKYLEKHKNGGYKERRTTEDLVVWISARQSAVIELPQDDGTISQNAYVIDAIAHIESQGYQVNQQPIQG